MNSIQSLNQVPATVLSALDSKQRNLLDIILSKLGPVQWDAELNQYRFLSDWGLKNSAGYSSWMGRGETAVAALVDFLNSCRRYIRKDGYVVLTKFRSGSLSIFDCCMIHPETALYMPLKEEFDLY